MSPQPIRRGEATGGPTPPQTRCSDAHATKSIWDHDCRSRSVWSHSFQVPKLEVGMAVLRSASTAGATRLEREPSPFSQRKSLVKIGASSRTTSGGQMLGSGASKSRHACATRSNRPG